MAPAMSRTTIPVDPKVLERLRRFGSAGESYDTILTRLLDDAAERAFTAELAQRFRAMRPDEWVELTDF